MPNRALRLIVFLACLATGALASASTSRYQADHDGFLWLQHGRPNALARQALEILEAAPSHGLRSRDYQLDVLNRLHRQLLRDETDFRVEYEGLMTDALLRLFRDLRPALANEEAGGDASSLSLTLLGAVYSDNLRHLYDSLLPRHEQYTALRAQLRRQEHLIKRVAPPEIGRGSALRIGSSGIRVRALRTRLVDSPHHLQLLDDVFDASLESAVKKYQSLHGLAADGVVGRRTQQHLDMSAAQRAARIRLALARWRELPVSLGDRYVHVNIPEYRLEMISGGKPIVQMRVVVGSQDDPTPTFNDEIERLVFNPYWHVPRRIALEELVPQAAQTPGYLTSQNYEILDAGLPVDEASVDWAAVNAANFRFRIRQRPGLANALGAVKFLFPNPLNIYLHDSPARSLYTRSTRAFSHGCIRVEDPQALAQALLDASGDDWNADRIDATMRKGSRRQINLDQTVPVYLTYITARVTESGELALPQDVYGRDQAALRRYL